MTTIPFPTDTHQLIHRSAVLAAGFTDDEYRDALHDKRIKRIARGIAVESGTRTPEELFRLRSVAAAVTSDKDVVLSHQSAAVIHGLEMLKPQLTRVHLTSGHKRGGYRTSTQHRHVGEFTDDDVVEVDGLAVTSLERTAVEVACRTTMGFAGALAVFDSALRKGADREVMETMLSEHRRVGSAVARRALRWADGKAENPGESWSRAQMIEACLPTPRLQHDFLDDDGNHVARTDFDWEGKLVGEFDGKVKYQKNLRAGEDPSQVVVREKAREDSLRAMGIMVIRWVWQDLEDGVVVDKVRRWLIALHLAPA